MLTINSGDDVAKETTVIPITILEIFKFKESATDDFINHLPPKTSRSKPIKTRKKTIKKFK